MIFVSVILFFFYFSAFGMAKMMYLLLYKRTKQTDSYWKSHIEKATQIDYHSPY